MPGSRRSRTPLDPVAFFLDECLPPQVARALSLVRFPITNAADQNKLGTKDPELIPWLSERGYVWITKDDAARVGHLPELRRAQLSVVWVRGFDRRKNMISDRELHLMLTVKLPEIEARLIGSIGRRHFLLYLSGERPVLDELDVETGKLLHRGGSQRRPGRVGPG